MRIIIIQIIGEPIIFAHVASVFKSTALVFSLACHLCVYTVVILCLARVGYDYLVGEDD